MNKLIKLPVIIFLLPLLFAVTSCGTSSSTSVSAQFQKKPYVLFTGNSSSMTVAWQTDIPVVNAIVQWGATNAYGSRETTNDSCYTIGGLAAATRVYYKVTVDNTAATGSFLTAPASSATTLAFYAYGENRDRPASQDAVVQQMMYDVSLDADKRQTFCLHTGDLTDRGGDEISWDNYVFNASYLNTLDFLRNLPLLPCLGNHDIYLADQSTPANPGTLARKYWPLSLYAAADRSYYSFDYGPAHFTVLDQYADNSAYTQESSAQYQWLASDLAGSTKSWKVVMFHEPAWTASTLEGSAGNNTAVQAKLCPLFKNNGVKLVLQGHAPYYARVKPADGITYLTLGGGGAQLSAPDLTAPNVIAGAQKHHFARFTIAGAALTVNIIDDSGAVIESFVIN